MFKFLISLCHLLVFINLIQSQSTKQLETEEITNITRYTYIVSLQNSDGLHICTGALISSYTVITAAKCVDDKYIGGTRSPEIWISVVDLFISDTSSIITRAVSEIIFHPDYISYPNNENNMAILVLDKEVTEVSAIRLGSDEVLRSNEIGMTEGSYIYFLGYGRTTGTSSYSSVLIKGTLTLEPDIQCETYTKNFNPKLLNCGRGSNPCYGDMGGPVFWNTPGQSSSDRDSLIGLISSLDCGDTEFSSYLDISGYFYQWIYETRNNITDRYTDSNESNSSSDDLTALLDQLFEDYGIDALTNLDGYLASMSYISED